MPVAAVILLIPTFIAIHVQLVTTVVLELEIPQEEDSTEYPHDIHELYPQVV